MGGLLVVFWLAGEGMITWRSVKELHMPPSPRALLVSSGLFVALGALATYQPAKGVATAFAGALDLAVLLQILPGSGTPTAIKANSKAGGWASIGLAGNTVIIPDGTSASTQIDTTCGTQKATNPSTGNAGAGGTAAQNQQVAQQVIASNPAFAGWGSGSEWSALVQLWNDESGWSTSATNPSSGAYGIPQSLHGSKGGQGGNEFNSSASEGLTATQLAGANAGNAADQILWGLEYILATYGSPSKALAHENSAGWY